MKPHNRNVTDQKIVLHVSEAYGGGVQAAIQRYANNSPGLNHRLIVRDRVAHDIDSDFSIETVNYEGSVGGFLLAARRHILDLRPEVVHLHSSFAGLLRVFDFGPDIQIVYTPHAYAFLRQDCSLISRWMFRIVEMALSVRRQTIAAISPFEAAQAAVLAGRQTKVKYLPNIVEQINHNPQRCLVDRAKAEVVMAGRISPQKDPLFFAEAARKSKSDVRWTWIGDGDPEARAALNEAGVFVTGWLPNALVMKHLGSADLYLHTARWEGAPITLLEAAALGTPILARKVESMVGLGYPFAGETPSDVAKAVDRFFSDSSYHEQTRKLTDESVRVHTSEAQSQALTILYGGGY